MKNIILKFVAAFSLIIFSHKLMGLLYRIFSLFCSYRFFLSILNSKGRGLIQYPFYALGHKYMSIGSNFSAGPGFRVECIDNYGHDTFRPLLIIGDNVSFNFRCHIGVINKVVIEDNVLVGSNVLITDHFHGKTLKRELQIAPIERSLFSKGPVIIEKNVWIGENVCVLPNVKIGHNSIIGANSVVTHDIPPYSIAVGNPVRIVKI
ncbi:acyltransferase [Bacteroides sp.]|uniref:acyltransferase n=1 Tax=Bacteroides sp. TaxID=29523 RepID=UPI0040278C5B